MKIIIDLSDKLIIALLWVVIEHPEIIEMILKTLIG